MSTIVVRAPDTDLAMDEVVKRLGPNAYILSTKQKNGQVEIQATIQPPNFREPLTAEFHKKTFGEVLAERTDQGQTSAVDYTKLDFFEHSSSMTNKQKLKPDISSEIGGWPPISPTFIADLWMELSQNDSHYEGFFNHLCNAILPTQSAGLSQRTLVVGLKGSGKTLTAARLAAMKMAFQYIRNVRLIVPRKERLLVTDPLTGYARLMGLNVERPIQSEVIHNAEWKKVDASLPQVFDLNDTSPEQTASYVIEDQTEVILCIPSGLHPLFLSRYLRDWRAVSPIVCLTRTDVWEPRPEELAVIAGNGLRIGLIGAGSTLINTLSHPTSADLRKYAQGWLSPKLA